MHVGEQDLHAKAGIRKINPSHVRRPTGEITHARARNPATPTTTSTSILHHHHYYLHHHHHLEHYHLVLMNLNQLLNHLMFECLPQHLHH